MLKVGLNAIPSSQTLITELDYLNINSYPLIC